MSNNIQTFEFDLQLFGGKGSSQTTVESYQPTEYELQLQQAQANYANAVSPNALYLNDTARKLLEDSLGTVQVDYNGMNSTAQKQIKDLQNYLEGLAGKNDSAVDQTNQKLDDISGQFSQAASSSNNKLEGVANAAKNAAGQENSFLSGLGSRIDSAANDVNTQLDDYISGNKAAADSTNNALSGYINKNNAATDKVNNALTGYINQGATATNGANADLSEYIRNNKGALGTVDRSLTGLESGRLPTDYQLNMENAIRTALQRTLGDNVNALAQRGVINSSVTNSALNDIERNAADSVAQQYLQNINLLSNLAQQKFSDYITADQQNAAMTQQKLDNTNANIDRGANLTQQQYSNTMGNNATNASLAQQQLQNTLGVNSTNAGLAQQQFGNTATAVNTNAGLSGQRSSNTQNALNTAANAYSTQYNQSSDSLSNQAQIAQQQLQNTLGGNEANHNTANSWGSLIQTPITTAAMAQEAAQTPATNLWNASLGLNGSTTGALAAAAGQGTRTSTTTQSSGGNNFLSGLLSAGVAAFCFPAGTKVKMADGTEKNIEDVQPGDEVQSIHGKEAVIRKCTPHKERIYRIQTADGKTTSASATQPFMDERGEWVDMKDIRRGTSLQGAGVVTKKTPLGVVTVYDFETTGENAYIVDGGFVAMGGSYRFWRE